MAFELPALPYAYNALEPYFDARTMEIHHDKHHRAYVDKLNKALEGAPDLQKQSLETLLRSLSTVPEKYRGPVKNNGGQHYNHSFFWTILSASSSKKPTGEVAKAIDAELGGFETFQKNFSDCAATHFGSGWAWLCVDKGGKLIVTGHHDGDCPLSFGQEPLLTIDVWEHAYYLKYQNRRPEYIQAFWQVVNWDEVNRRYTEAKKKM